MKQVIPLPRLAAQKSQTSKNCPRQVSHYSFFISLMACVYSKHHRYRTHNQYKGHYAHKHKRGVDAFSRSGVRSEDFIWIRPAVARKSNRTVSNKKSTEGKRVTH